MSVFPDYETLTASSEAMIHIASIDNLAKRITDEATPTWRGTYSGVQGNTPRSNAPSDSPEACLPLTCVQLLLVSRQIIQLLIEPALDDLIQILVRGRVQVVLVVRL